MDFISWIVVGAIAGFLANLIMGSSRGLLMMVVLGIVGGLVRVPGTVHATRAGAHRATSALPSLPDSTLLWLAAGSAGLGGPKDKP